MKRGQKRVIRWVTRVGIELLRQLINVRKAHENANPQKVQEALLIFSLLFNISQIPLFRSVSLHCKLVRTVLVASGHRPAWYFAFFDQLPKGPAALGQLDVSCVLGVLEILAADFLPTT